MNDGTNWRSKMKYCEKHLRMDVRVEWVEYFGCDKKYV